jgi:hypothetical protein
MLENQEAEAGKVMMYHQAKPDHLKHLKKKQRKLAGTILNVMRKWPKE